MGWISRETKPILTNSPNIAFCEDRGANNRPLFLLLWEINENTLFIIKEK